MKLREIHELERELDTYIESFFTGLGREERRRALASYITGLLLDGERKSIEPMAARLVESADEIEAMRQRLQQILLKKMGICPLCRQPFAPQGAVEPSRM